jgi:hypothetical protein
MDRRPKFLQPRIENPPKPPDQSFKNLVKDRNGALAETAHSLDRVMREIGNKQSPPSTFLLFYFLLAGAFGTLLTTRIGFHGLHSISGFPIHFPFFSTPVYAA